MDFKIHLEPIHICTPLKTAVPCSLQTTLKKGFLGFEPNKKVLTHFCALPKSLIINIFLSQGNFPRGSNKNGPESSPTVVILI